MKYCDFIDVNEGFQTSINLEFDLNKVEKVKSYIPTEQSVKVLGGFLKSFYYSKENTNRASVLIGPYGRGKSHLLLVLAALTSMDLFKSGDYTAEEARQIQLDLCEKIENIDSEIGILAKTIVNDGIRTLPVIINSNSTDINQSFLIAIKEALEIAGLDYLLPNTYFDAAIMVLDKWKAAYPDAIKKLTKELKKRKESVDNLYIGLKQFEQSSYMVFCECYPIIAAGAVFNPLTNMDVVKLYMAVVDALCEQTAYTGINIIFDEFSKFLEANLSKSNMLNFKIIQDMAEAAARSEKRQIHFTCITHKDILDYSASDSFKTVEGRFNRIQYIVTLEQSYELIANAIPKKKAFESMLLKFDQDFRNAGSSASNVNIFDEMPSESFEKKVVRGCFPLAPLSAFFLLQISEVVGQNERTLFTFLAKQDHFSLPEFLMLERENLDFVTVDGIYDYFEELLKKEVFNASVHSIWIKTDTALKQAKNIDQKRILKAIAIISIIQDERIKTVPAHIKAALMMNDNAFDTAVKQLLKCHILSQRDSSEFVLLTANGVDIQKNVLSYINSRISRINRCSILETYFPLGYVIPRGYNDRFSMMRYFKKIYLEASTILNYKSGKQLLNDYPYDGVIIYVLADAEYERLAVTAHVATFANTPQIVVCLSRKDVNLEPLLKKVVAIQHLKTSDQANDPHYLEEIQFYEEDICKQIAGVVEEMYSPKSQYSKYCNGEGILDVYRQVDLNQKITQICLCCYSRTPIINNEMVNKTTLNSQNRKGRNSVIDWVLSHSDDAVIPCMDGYGPEVSIFKSMYSHTGLAESENVCDEGINEVLRIINQFISSSESKAMEFKNLYEILQNAPYRMRKGVIPLFIAYVLRKYKKDAILYFKEKEVEITSAILSALNDSPEDYSLLLEKGTQEREKMLDDLEKLFENCSDYSYTSANRIYSVVKAMQNWMRSLPEYTKKHMLYFNGGVETPVDNSIRVVRNDLLKFELNAREVLFKNWKTRLSPSGDLRESVLEVRRVKKYLDTHISNFKKELSNYLVTLFVPGYSGSLTNAINLWYQKLPESTKRHVFDSEANTFLALAENRNSFDDQRLLNELSVLFVSMAIEDWTDQLAKQFISLITGAIDRINNFVEVKTVGQECKLAISLSGTQVEKTFSSSEISPLGKTVLSNLRAVLEEYNDAVEPDEQLAIIAKLIGDIVQ